MIGILGGTFDPPHRAHLAMALAAKDRLGLRTVLLAPATAPPHKDLGDVTSYEDRLAMLEVAVSGLPGLEVSTLEEERRGSPSYTVDLLRAAAKRFGPEIYFIVGSDSLRDLPTWKDPEGVLAMATLVVFLRSGAPPVLGVTGAASVIIFEEPVMDVSSSEIRDGIRRNDPSAREKLPDAVYQYITTRGLYGSRP